MYSIIYYQATKLYELCETRRRKKLGSITIVRNDNRSYLFQVCLNLNKNLPLIHIKRCAKNSLISSFNTTDEEERSRIAEKQIVQTSIMRPDQKESDTIQLSHMFNEHHAFIGENNLTGKLLELRPLNLMKRQKNSTQLEELPDESIRTCIEIEPTNINLTHILNNVEVSVDENIFLTTSTQPHIPNPNSKLLGDEEYEVQNMEFKLDVSANPPVSYVRKTNETFEAAHVTEAIPKNSSENSVQKSSIKLHETSFDLVFNELLSEKAIHGKQTASPMKTEIFDDAEIMTIESKLLPSDNEEIRRIELDEQDIINWTVSDKMSNQLHEILSKTQYDNMCSEHFLENLRQSEKQNIEYELSPVKVNPSTREMNESYLLRDVDAPKYTDISDILIAGPSNESYDVNDADFQTHTTLESSNIDYSIVSTDKFNEQENVSAKELSNELPIKVGILSSELTKKAKIGSCDNFEMSVQTSDKSKSAKKYCCVFCHKLYSKIVRHLETMHKDLEEVKKFSALKAGNPERKAIIRILRNTGNFEFNTNRKLNNGELIVSRRPNIKFNKNATDYKTCVNCLNTYSITNIRHHVSRCTGQTNRSDRSILVLGRTVEGRIDPKANDDLRLTIFPVLREDAIIRLIRYDWLIIAYGNRLCMKYTEHYQHNMIRARLRLMGRLLLAIKMINKDVSDFASIYYPLVFDSFLAAVKIVAQYDPSTHRFKAPAVAANLGTFIKQVGDVLLVELSKQEKDEQEKKAQKFLTILSKEYFIHINKAVIETQARMRRHKKVILPSIEDVKKLRIYLKESRRVCYQKLLNEFSLVEWVKLAKLTVGSLIVFNRRRPGDIQNITVEDYKNQRSVGKDTGNDIYETLGENEQRLANKYTRCEIRGKKMRSVGVILSPDVRLCIDLLLKYRNEVVPEENEFLFGLPSKNRIKVVDGCEVMRTYSDACGAKNPKLLRATTLRKHIATMCVKMDLSENTVADLAHFMGHSDKVHRDYYELPVLERELLRVTKLLETEMDISDRDDDFNLDQDDEHTVNFGIDEINSRIMDNEYQRYEENNNIPTIHENDILSSQCHKSYEIKHCRKKFNDDCYNTGSLTESSSDESFIPSKNKIKNRKIVKDKRKSEIKYSKIRWTETEKNVVMENFTDFIKQNRLPGFDQISMVKAKNPCLRERSIPQIKAWINNQSKSMTKPVKKEGSQKPKQLPKVISIENVNFKF